MKKDCNGRPIEKKENRIVKLASGFMCTACNTKLKHQNNLTQHKKLCSGLKVKKEFT